MTMLLSIDLHNYILYVNNIIFCFLLNSNFIALDIDAKRKTGGKGKNEISKAKVYLRKITK